MQIYTFVSYIIFKIFMILKASKMDFEKENQWLMKIR